MVFALLSGTGGCVTDPVVPFVSTGPPGALALEVPRAPRHRTLPRRRVATGLANPRGMLALGGGQLLVAVAGTGDPESPDTGGLLRLDDWNADGDYDDTGERSELLGAQRSVNILDLVHRDEVFGMAALAVGGGEVLATLAFFDSPSILFRLRYGTAEPIARIDANLNDLAYDPVGGQWLAVSSSDDSLLRLEDGAASTLTRFGALAGGQDAVPGYLAYDPTTRGVLVSLFGGSTEGETGGSGVELVARAGRIVRVDPKTGRKRTEVTGLTAPTDLVVGADGMLYVLELCDGFDGPGGGRAELWEAPTHGGFRRFSGRLLRIDRDKASVSVLAAGLDTPTNLAFDGGRLLVAGGMGTPGRPLPVPGGASVPLVGYIEAFAVLE